MFFQYGIFYRKFGVRRLLELRTPRIHKTEEIALPKNSIFHFNPSKDGIVGPSATDILFRADHQKIPIDFVQELVSDDYVQRKKIRIVSKIIHDYIHHNNNRFKYYKNLIEDGVQNAYLAVISYTFINELYMYRLLPLTPLYEWLNLQKTIYSTVNKLAETTKMNQFVVLEMPNIIPPRAFFHMYSEIDKKAMFKIFKDYRHFNLLDLWRWADPATRDMSALSQIKEENFDFVNLVIRYDNLNYILNLGKLFSFITPTEKVKSVISFEQLQKLLLRSVMSLHEEKDKIDSLINTDIIADANTQGDDDTSDINSSPELDSNSLTNQNTAATLIDNSDIVGSHEDDMALALKDLDKDLEEIDKYAQVVEEDEIIESKKDNSTTEETPVVTFETNEEEVSVIAQKYLTHIAEDTKIIDKINKHKESGLLNMTDYKSNIRTYEKFQKMPNPYTRDDTFNEYIKIPKEHIDISHEDKALSARDTLIDPRMAQTSITPMDKKYIKNVITKDTLTFVKSLMNAGLMIDDYSIDRKDDALGSYEIHTVKIKPVVGPSSVIHFKLPIVNEDGEMNINGKKYYLRKQRAD
jgi:hypothetical protein